MTCDCMTCRIAREAFGEDLSCVDPVRAGNGVEALVKVLGVGLAFADDSALNAVIKDLWNIRGGARIATTLASHHEAGNA